MALDQAYSGYEGLHYTRDELQSIMRDTYNELIEFVSTREFGALMLEIGSLKPNDRPKYVFDVLLNDAVLAERGVVRPEGVLIQRSAFGDRRPTIFVVKKFLPEKYATVWQNMNITFDNAFIDATVSRTPEVSWRRPLPIDYQAQKIAEGQDLEGIEKGLKVTEH